MARPQDGELLAQCEVLQREAAVGLEQGGYGTEEGEKEWRHGDASVGTAPTKSTVGFGIPRDG